MADVKLTAVNICEFDKEYLVNLGPHAALMPLC